MVNIIFLFFSLIGLTDDLLKILHKNSIGFRGSIKLVLQFILIGAISLWLQSTDPVHQTNAIFFSSSNYLHLGFLYFVFVSFVIVGSSNAVNLTDGLDGLVTIPAIINLFCLIYLISVVSNQELSAQKNVIHIKNCEELIFFCSALIGSILGFLQFNLKPAKIFMGDVGSLAIGSVLGLIAIIVKQEFIFFVISLLFVIESLSVILQVSSYKLRKKRIFLMAPIHHHFEKLGWTETVVIKRFWLASLAFGIFGIIIFNRF
jgi:phospho-N-acetylmuramoyl-pentapeptide-transferase